MDKGVETMNVSSVGAASADTSWAVAGSRILVVGGNGFLGSHIVDALLEVGAKVRVLAPHQEPFRSPKPEVEYQVGRLQLGTHVESALRGCDAVIDAVSPAVPSTAGMSPASTISAAIGASAWLAELCRGSSSVRALVTLSSGGTVYGARLDGRPHREDDPLAPSGAYGALKAGSELAVSAMLHGSHVRAVNLRVSNAYGERQNWTRPQGVIAVAFAKMRARQPLTVFGDTVRDYIHASDVASAVVFALRHGHSGSLNIGSGVGVSLADLLGRLEQVAGQTLTIEQRPLRDFDVPHSVLNIDRARSLGWIPTVGLDHGIKQTWDWLLCQPSLVP